MSSSLGEHDRDGFQVDSGGYHSHDHLLAAQQRVADELASSEGDGGVVVRHGDDWVMEVSG